MKFVDYQQICFINECVYWGKLKMLFKLSFYYQGMYFDMLVKINEVIVIMVKLIKYDCIKFDFGFLKFDENVIKDFGYVGFCVFYLINKVDKQDEIVIFFGVSYFCVVGKGQVYGLLVCGLVIDIVLFLGEEFLCFCEFWIEWLKVQDK